MDKKQSNGLVLQNSMIKSKAFNKSNISKEDSQNDEQVFLRSDVNELFDSMMIQTNFNLKKYSLNKQIQTKKNSNKQKIGLSFQNARDDVRLKMSSQFNEIKKQDQLFTLRNKKLQAQQKFKNQKKKEVLNTDNLNKLLKKNDPFISSNQINGMKTVNSFHSSTNLVDKSQQKEAMFSTTKHIGSSISGNNQNSKNVRRKIVSLSSKGHGAHRFDTESTIENKTISIGFKKKQKIHTQGIDIQNRQQYDPQFSRKQKKSNKYQVLQKKHNKGGPLKFKHVQNWLNNIIQQYCSDQYFDSSLTSAALKKYYIDSNSLMANGVQPGDVNRIYNSLFVYSIGFNNLIKQISKGNRELVKNIWIVYSLLVEYCAAGNYQTLIGQIQRDKLRKVQQLKVQIQRRQQIIQKNQQINQQKNMTMYKQLKRLKDQNINLANQRQILMQDFQQADQAFNQQVSLRLKFQNTINQIYGVHKELSNKHGRLFHDFNKKIQQLKRASEKYFQQTKTTQKIKYQLIDLKEKYNELDKINSHDKLHIDVLLQEQAKLKENFFETVKELERLKYVNVEKQRKMDQLQVQLNNNKIILELREKSSKQTHNQYRITLEENNKLFMVISEQRQQMQGLIKQKKEFNQNVLKILADSSYFKKKNEHCQNTIKALNQKILELETSLYKQSVQSQIHTKDLESYKKDLQNNYESISNMHKKNFELQEQLEFLRKYEFNMDNILQEKNSLIEELRSKLDSTDKKLMDQTHQLMNLQSKYKILEFQLRAQKQANHKRMQDFKRQQQTLTTNQTTLSKSLTMTSIQLQKYKNLFNNTLMDLKNEKFERSNLTLTYEQILKVVQKKNVSQKQMSIKINELQQQVNEYKQKYKITYLNLVNTKQQLNLIILHLKQKIQSQQQILDYKAHHYHPMVYQDLFHHYQKEIQLHTKTNKVLDDNKRKANSEKFQFQKNFKKTNADHQFELSKQLKNSSKIQQKLKQQLEYQKQQNNKISKRLSQLQILQSTYKLKVTQLQHKQSNILNQQKILNEIQTKNEKIAALYQEIQKIHDLKRTQISELQQKISDVENQKMNFVYEFKSKKQRQMKQQFQSIYKSQFDQMKQDYQKNLRTGRAIVYPPGYKPNPTNNNVNLSEEEAFENYFKEIVKTKTLEEILKIKKQQFQSFNQVQNKSFYDQIQNFFRRSSNNFNTQFFNRTNNFSSSKGSTQKDFSKSPIKSKNSPAYLQRLQNTNQDIKKRGSISRKLRIAYDYYGRT